MTAGGVHGLHLVERGFRAAEQWTIVIMALLLTGLALLQIILRNFFSTGWVWADALLRHMVMWLSFLGAARATTENRHIRIDLLPKLLPVRFKFLAVAVSDLFSMAVSAVLTYASWNFVMGERMAGGIAFATIPYWWVETIFPFSFGLMTLRFGWRAVNGLTGGAHLPNAAGEAEL